MLNEILRETPSQTAGPYVHIGTMPAYAGLRIRTQERQNVLTGSGVTGEEIRIEGQVLDGCGQPIRDAMLEIWQANAEGKHLPGFGWGRAATEFDTGFWRFETIRPGSVSWRDGRPQAPHVSLLVFARGINIHLHTRMYFPEDAEALAADPVLRMIEPQSRRTTLIAERVDGTGPATYRFIIRLQGPEETVFFDM